MSEIKKIETLFKEGKLTRREFIARVSALSLTATLSPALLGSRAEAGTPKKGGRFRVGMEGGETTDTLDPAILADFVPIFISWGLIKNNLVEIDYKGEAVPELAESWDAEPGAAKWTFKLRKDVEFHNGKTMDAEDVIASLNYHRNEGSKSAIRSILKNIKDIKADGKYTLVFKLDGGNADFPFILADYHLGISPAGTVDFNKGIGTGPYKMVEYEPGVRCFTKRHPNYFKEGRAHFDEVEVLTINDRTSRMNALQSGVVDCINQVESKIADLMQKSPGIKVIDVPGWLHYTLPMHTNTPPFDNNDVRLALKHAIDREHLLKIVLRGHGALGNDHPIPSNQKYYASELPQREYDPDRARFHIKKSGYENYTFTIHTEPTFPHKDIDALYQEHAKKAGINIKVVVHPTDGYGANVWNKVPWCNVWWFGRPTADQMLTTVYAANAPWNDTKFQHERFNKLLIEARAELDEEKRRDMYVEMQRILSDEGGVIIPLFASWITAASSKLKFKNVAGNANLDGNKAPERWWFES